MEDIFSSDNKLVSESKELIQVSRKFVHNKLQDSMIRNSLFAGIVFMIVANPAIFRFVGKFIKVSNPNIVLVLNAIVFAVIMYFGSIYIFEPVYTALFLTEGNSPLASEEVAMKGGSGGLGGLTPQ